MKSSPFRCQISSPRCQVSSAKYWALDTWHLRLDLSILAPANSVISNFMMFSGPSKLKFRKVSPVGLTSTIL